MHKSKLVGILHTFSSKEMRRFDEFIQSPYFNKLAGHHALFRVLRKYAPDFPEEKVDRYLIWMEMFPDRGSDDKEINYLMSGLLKLAVQFIGQQYYEELPLGKEIHQLYACENRKLDKHFHHLHRRLDRWQSAHPHREEAYFLRQYDLEGLSTRFQLRRQARAYDAHLQQSVNMLDDFYLIAKLRLTCELINRQKILSATYDIRLVDELLAYLSYYDYEQVPAMAIYYRILQLLTQDDAEDHFKELKALLDLHLEVFPDDKKDEIFSFAQNYCIRMVRQGNLRYLEELLDLYKAGLKAGVFLQEGQLSPWKYKNIASVGIRLGQYAWVEGFTNAYRDRLPKDFSETAYAYNRAFLHYSRGEHEQALRFLSKVTFADVFFSLDTRKMMLMIYFEQGELEAMMSLIAAFRVYLNRNKLISEGNRRAYTNFLNLLNAIYKAHQSGSEDVRALKATIASTHPLVEEAWLSAMAARGFFRPPT